MAQHQDQSMHCFHLQAVPHLSSESKHRMQRLSTWLNQHMPRSNPGPTGGLLRPTLIVVVKEVFPTRETPAASIVSRTVTSELIAFATCKRKAAGRQHRSVNVSQRQATERLCICGPDRELVGGRPSQQSSIQLMYWLGNDALFEGHTAADKHVDRLGFLATLHC